MRDIIKRYAKGDVTVVWQPGLCVHSQVCFHGLPAVFDPRKRPWVSVDGADTSEIVEQVKRCPSGALSIAAVEVAPGVAPEAAPQAGPVRIEPQANGPLLVRGEVDVRRADGTLDRKHGSCALCRCGQSSNKPYCDGTHAKVGFQG